MLDGELLNLTAVSMANAFAEGRTIDELNQYSVLFSLMGDAFGVLAATRARAQDSQTAITVN